VLELLNRFARTSHDHDHTARSRAHDTGRANMPMFMDVHEGLPDGAGFDDVVGAHAADVKTQGPFGVDYKAYWVDETQRKVFCLVEAPSAEAAIAVHREAHGLVADRIFEVREGF
jgi:hypothetical protein